MADLQSMDSGHYSITAEDSSDSRELGAFQHRVGSLDRVPVAPLGAANMVHIHPNSGAAATRPVANPHDLPCSPGCATCRPAHPRWVCTFSSVVSYFPASSMHPAVSCRVNYSKLHMVFEVELVPLWL